MTLPFKSFPKNQEFFLEGRWKVSFLLQHQRALRRWDTCGFLLLLTSDWSPELGLFLIIIVKAVKVTEGSHLLLPSRLAC